MLDSLFDLIRKHYDQGISDYSLTPLVKRSHDGRVVGRVGDGDVLVFACRRGERNSADQALWIDFPILKNISAEFSLSRWGISQ